jgi:TolB-like protein/Tfp pilus assembly protein PilF
MAQLSPGASVSHYQGAAALDTTVSPSRDEVTNQQSGDAATRLVSAASTQAASLKSASSSAEYIVSGIRQHKLAVAIAVLMLSVGGVGLGLYVRARNTEVAIESIAVLPFENQNRDPNTDYLSDGVTESIINSLTQLPNLRVIARSSVFRYKGKETDPFAIGKELGVRAVLIGRMMQRGDNLTISTELIDVRDNKQLWGEQYERKASDLMSLQRDIAGQITSTLRLKISGDAHNRMLKHYTDNPEAYQLYLKGLFYWNRRTGESLKKSIEYFDQAIEKDPSYALAYAGKAVAYDLFYDFGVGSSHDSSPLAKAAALKALELDGSLAEAHAALGLYKCAYEWDQPASERELRKAIELNPNYATAHQWLGNAPLLAMGRFDESIAEGKRAEELDPLSPIIRADLGFDLLYARRYDEAIAQLRRTLTLEPNFQYAHWVLGSAYDLKGMYGEAIAEYQKALQISDDPRIRGLLARAYALSARRAEALKILEQLKADSGRRFVPAFAYVMICIGLSDQNQALAWLEKDFAEHSYHPANYKVDPMLDPLRSDPRFADLVRRVGLPQ